jgi:hypothetical protein
MLYFPLYILNKYLQSYRYSIVLIIKRSDWRLETIECELYIVVIGLYSIRNAYIH